MLKLSMVALSLEIAQNFNMNLRIFETERGVFERSVGIAQVENSGLRSEGVADPKTDHIETVLIDPVFDPCKIRNGVEIAVRRGLVSVLQVEDAVTRGKQAFFIDAPQVINTPNAVQLVLQIVC